MSKKTTVKRKTTCNAEKVEKKSRRKTPPPPLCPVHRLPMLSRHASATHQYRYCRVAGCTQTSRTNRVYWLKNAMSLWLWGKVDRAGNVRLHPDVFNSRTPEKNS